MPLHIIGGVPANVTSSMGTGNLTNHPAMTAPAGPPVTITPTGPLGATITTMRTPMAPDIHLDPVLGTPVPCPGISPPGMGIPTQFRVLSMTGPVSCIADKHLNIPVPPLIGVASGMTGGPSMIAPSS